MRTVLMGDIVAAARALLAVGPAERVEFIGKMVAEAHAAHLFYKRKQKPHSDWGNGSLMARANMCPQAAEPFGGSLEYLDAIQSVAQVLIERRKTIDQCGNSQFSKSSATLCKPLSRSTFLPPPTPSRMWFGRS